MAIHINPTGISIAYTLANLVNATEYLLLKPTLWKEEANPCHKCIAKRPKETTYNPTRTGFSNLWTVSA
jgi:hypothetical protein